ncbi:MAG: hypothetical protein BWY70_01569 [Bacteroidetes bacterium ADurb.Bin408]|nr:MAG: hypothetical protein BWY70_01569 [Bacteroidetes bacterium ADurb.Bin408]
MSPRIKRLRKVVSPPAIKGFKPYGPEYKPGKMPAVIINIEEYEALRLCDYDLLNHHQASAIMGVSRPTFTRMYASVRQKIAAAFAEGRPIRIEGGKIYFDSDWYECSACGCFFNNPEKEQPITSCPLCRSQDIINYEPSGAGTDRAIKAVNDNCYCPSCGYEKPHQVGVPCVDDLCPDCKTPLRRKRKTKFYKSL